MSPITAAVAPDPGRTIEEDLERRRLAHRAARLEFVLARLEARVRRRSDDGAAPAPLRLAVALFTDELGTVRARLAVLDGRRR